jgi:hypothetical protein
MIRTLVIIAAVSFALSIASLAGSFAVAGGPFFIDDHWRFHHSSFSDDDGDSVDIQVGPPPVTAPAPAPAKPAKPAAPKSHPGAPI